MQLPRRQAIRSALAGLLAASSRSKAQDNSAWRPERDVSLVVPFPNGSGTDLVGRILARELAHRWRVNVAVDNRAGIAGMVGAEFVAKANPDGHTLLMGTLGTQCINPLLYASMPYDAARAFAPISLVAQLPMVLVVRSAAPARTIAQFIAEARQQAKPPSFGSSGFGGAPHIAALLFERSTGLKLTHISYRGSVLAVDDLLQGRIEMAFITAAEARPHLLGGRLRGLVVTSPSRVSFAPDVPTLSEAVAAGLDFVPWIGLLSPRATPARIVHRISDDVREALGRADIRDLMLSASAIPIGSTPAQFTKLIDEERRRYAMVVRPNEVSIGK